MSGNLFLFLGLVQSKNQTIGLKNMSNSKSKFFFILCMKKQSEIRVKKIWSDEVMRRDRMHAML